MNRFLGVLIALVTLGIAPLALSTWSPAQSPIPPVLVLDCWPPKVENLFSHSATGINIPAGGRVKLTTVPNGKYLVVTTVGAYDVTSAGSSYYLRILEVANGVDSVKVAEPMCYPNSGWMNSVSHQEGLGVVFQPNSDVVLENISTTQVITGNVSIVGYLAVK